jgi:hypothetical protein
LVFVENLGHSLQAASERCFQVRGEGEVFEQHEMEVVSEEICSGDSVVAVVDSEEGDLSLLAAAFGEIGDDADAVLVVAEKWAGVRVGRIPPDYAIGL